MRTAQPAVRFSSVPCQGFQLRNPLICLSGVFTQKNKYFPSVHRWLQSAAKGPDISRTLWFTRFLASFSTERFASEDMTASQANVSGTMLGGIRQRVTDAVKHAIFREFNVLVATKEAKT